MKITGYLAAALVAAFAFVGSALAQGGPGGGPGPVPPGPWVVSGANTIYNKGTVIVGNGLTGLGIGNVNISGNYYVNGAAAKTTVNGQPCALGGTCTVTAVAASLVVGTTGISGGTSTRVLYDNAGILGEYTISGSGNVAMTTSPVFTTPNIGAATATTVNNVTITQPATSATLTIANGKTLTVNNSLTLAGTDATTMTFPPASDTVVGIAATQTLSNKTFVAPALGAATGTSLALGGATIGSNALAVTGTAVISSTLTLTSAALNSTSAFQLLNGAAAQGLQSASVCIDASYTNCSTLPTNGLQVSGQTTLKSALTYGGVTLANSVTGGSGSSMVLSASPTFTGALTLNTGADNVTFETVNGLSGNGRLIASIDAGANTHYRSQNSATFNLGVNTTDYLTVATTGVTIVTGLTATGLLHYSDINSGNLATQAQYFAATANTLVPTSVIYTSETTTTYGATTTLDFSTFLNTAITLTGNITNLVVLNAKAGQAGTITFIQDATGSRTTVWNNVFKFSGGAQPTLSTAPSVVDVLAYSCRSATFCAASLLKQVQ